MAIERAGRPQRLRHSNLIVSREAHNEAERLKISQGEPAAPAINGFIDAADGAPLQTLLDAVDDQRIKLVNVLGIVHSMSSIFEGTAEDTAPEICAAFELLALEIQSVVAELKKASSRERSCQTFTSALVP